VIAEQQARHMRNIPVRRGFVPAAKPRTRPLLLLPCNWLSTEETDTEVDIGRLAVSAETTSLHSPALPGGQRAFI